MLCGGVCKMSDHMDEPDTNRNCAQHYGGGMYCPLSIHEGYFTFCWSYEGC